jgi:DNA processing protein
MQLPLTTVSSSDAPALAAISPRRELGAYEALWLEKGVSFKSIAAKFAADPNALPSDFVSPSKAEQCAAEVMCLLKAEVIRPH